MANKTLFGKQLTSYNDDLGDIDDLLSKLSEEEINELNNEIDPDNSLLPAHARCRDQTTKAPTGKFNRQQLLDFIKKAAEEEKDWDEAVPFEKKIRGKIFEKKADQTLISTKELNDMGFDTEFDSEFNQTLINATEEELVDLAAILGFTGMLNQSQFHASIENRDQDYGGFQGVAKPEKLKIVEDMPPNATDVEESIKQVEENDSKLIELNFNNIKNISAERFKALCSGLQKNSNLKKLSCASTRLTNGIAEPFIEALEKNSTLESLNLESNFLTGEFIIKLVNAVNNESSAIQSLQLSNQRNSTLGVRVELELSKLVKSNSRLLHLGVDLDTAEARVQIRDHLAKNIDEATRKKRKA